MSKTKVVALSVLITLMLTPLAYARTQSFASASNAIKIFNKETKSLLPKNINKERKKAFTEAVKDSKKEATSKIKWLRRSEEPSPRRFSRLFKIVDYHLGTVIKEANKLSQYLTLPDGAKVEAMSLKLQKLRGELMGELQATAYSERKANEKYKANPVLDRSPYEQMPGDTRGLYDR